VKRDTPTHEALRALDAHLCDLKEMQIRDGLHVFAAPARGPASPICWYPLPGCRGQKSGRRMPRCIARWPRIWALMEFVIR